MRSRSHEVEQAVKEIRRRLDLGVQRPLSMLVATLDQIGQTCFHSVEGGTLVANAIREYLLPEIERALFSETRIRELAARIDKVMHQLDAIAKAPARAPRR